MKKSLHFLIVGLAFCLCAGTVSAKPVDETTARRVAENYLRAQGMTNTAALVNVTSETPFTEFYIFAAPQGGFAIVSADNCVRPILGYSTGNRFETKHMPEHIVSWLKGYEAEIRHYRNHGVANSEWNVENGDLRANPPATPMVDTLLTKWNQGQYYNSMCPDDTNHWTGHPYTGCVATSMAQVMKFWNHPATGYLDHSYYHNNGDTSYGWQYANFGATTYQWSNMPASLSYSTSAAQNNAVAELMYHVGVSVNMNYGINGSGAKTGNKGNIYLSCQENALVGYFKYSPALHSVYRSDFTDDEWNAMLRADLDAGHPILYAGNDVGAGHSFVLDGYADNGYFHINWGWGSYCDGYYPIGGLNPAPGGAGGNSTSSYNNNNDAIIGIQPNLLWGNSGTITCTSSNANWGSAYPQSFNYNFFDTVYMSASPNHGYRFTGWSDGYSYLYRPIIGTGGDYTFTANFAPIGGDTVMVCGNGGMKTSYGYGDTTSESYWGVKFDSSYLESGREMHTVEFYVAYPGEYSLSVYLGRNSAEHLMADTTVTIDSTEAPLWKSVTLGSPVVVDGSESIWIGLSNVGVEYPACVTNYGGINESFLWGSDFHPYGNDYGYSFMIRGLFRPTTSVPVPHVSVSGPEQVSVGDTVVFQATGTPGATITWSLPGISAGLTLPVEARVVYDTPGTYTATATITNAGGSSSSSASILVVDYTEGDTVSYCLDRNYYGNVGEMYDTTRWGIMLPHKYLHSRDTLQDVLLYVTAPGDYTLNVYQGGDNAPGQLVYSNTYTFDSNTYGYVSCTPATPLAIDTTQNLWITFMYPLAGVYPANGSYYMGDPNSDWYFDSDDGAGWGHLSQIAPGLARSWFIKAVTSAKPATYTVTVNRVMADNSALDPTMCSVTGEGTYTEGETVTLTATGTPDATDFLAWVNANGDSIAANPYTFVINSDVTLTAVFRSTVGIDGVETPNITLYPNPATESVTVGGFAMPATVTAIDLNGREYGEWKTEGVELSIDLKGVAAGEYFLRIVSGGTTTVRKLVVK